MKKGQIAEGIVERVEFPNKGIAYTADGDRVIVKNTIPGQKVSFAVNKVRKGKAEGRLLQVVEPSALEMDSACPHFGACGGRQIGGEDHIIERDSLRADIFLLINIKHVYLPPYSTRRGTCQ